MIKKILSAAAAFTLSITALPQAGINTAAAEKTPHELAVEMTSKMELRQKICQMMFLSIRTWNDAGQTSLSAPMKAYIEKNSFGGVLYFADNVTGTAQTVRLSDEVQEAAANSPYSIPLLIAADQEGGTITRLGTGTSFCGNMALAATGDENNVYEAAKTIGQELSSVGINVSFSPVVDVNNNPNNPIIGLRSFSSDPGLVAKMAPAYINGLKKNNIIGSAKHFPGHGDTSTDSHTGFPLINKSYDELKAVELVPFQKAIDSDVDMIMTAHIQYPQIEKNTYTSVTTGEKVYLPATLSKTFLTNILRGDMGFDGVIVTDDMQMDAVTKNFNMSDSAELAINAGADMILEPVTTSSNDSISKMETYITAIENKVKSGAISESRINESCTRVIELKYKRGLFEDQGKTQEQKVAAALATVGSKANHDKEMEITKKAITLVKNDNKTLPVSLGSGETAACFYPYESRFNSFAYAIDSMKADKTIAADASVSYNCYEDKKASDFTQTVKNSKVVVVSDECSGEASLSNANAAFIDDLISLAHSFGKPVVVISARLPYDLARFTAADALLASYGHKIMPVIPSEYNGEVTTYGPNYPAAVMTVFGGNEPTGKLPADIYAVEGGKFTNNILYPLGWGLNYNTMNYSVKDEYEVHCYEGDLGKAVLPFTLKNGKASFKVSSGSDFMSVNESGILTFALKKIVSGQIYNGSVDITFTADNGSKTETKTMKIKLVYESGSHIVNLGDVNRDGRVDSPDATYILIMYADALNETGTAIPAASFPGADVNSDSKVDSNDATVILIKYAEALIDNKTIKSL